MNNVQRLVGSSLLAIGAISLAACSNMTQRERDTAIGAGVGGAAGAILSDGSPAGTIGGAAVGGVVGNQIGKEREKDRRDGK